MTSPLHPGGPIRPTRPVDILIVDDSESDRALARAVFTRRKIFNRILEAEDGVSALELLRDPVQPRPQLILLDLNMPGMDGRELLVELKSDPALRVIPVLVFTSSELAEDIGQAYRNHCSGYLTKPVDEQSLFQIAAALADFWVALVKYPSEPREP